MNPPYSPQAEPNAYSPQAGCAGDIFLLAIWLDPSEPAKYAQITYICWLGMCLCTVAGLVSVALGYPLVTCRILTHAVDLTIFSFLMYFTGAPNSPFFVYFVFSLVSATLPLAVARDVVDGGGSLQCSSVWAYMRRKSCTTRPSN